MRFQSTTLDSLIRAGSDQADEVAASSSRLSRSAVAERTEDILRLTSRPRERRQIEPATSGVRDRKRYERILAPFEGDAEFGREAGRTAESESGASSSTTKVPML